MIGRPVASRLGVRPCRGRALLRGRPKCSEVWQTLHDDTVLTEPVLSNRRKKWVGHIQWSSSACVHVALERKGRGRSSGPYKSIGDVDAVGFEQIKDCIINPFV